jgi:hypothetical protein
MTMAAKKVLMQAVNLSQLSDGYTGKLMDAALLEVCNDIDDRHDGKPRKITMTLTIKAAGEGRVKIGTEVTVKKPAMVPPETIARIDMNAGGFTFNPDCTENPDQKTIHEEADAA